jgi:hypothetical protein
MEGKGKTITHAYIADGDARTRSHSGADQDQSIRAKTRHQFFGPRKDHDYLTEAGSKYHSFSSERGRTSRVKTKRKKARTRFNYKTNMKQAQLLR